eukprot:EG_transcript_20873
MKKLQSPTLDSQRETNPADGNGQVAKISDSFENTPLEVEEQEGLDVPYLDTGREDEKVVRKVKGRGSARFEAFCRSLVADEEEARIHRTQSTLFPSRTRGNAVSVRRADEGRTPFGRRQAIPSPTRPQPKQSPANPPPERYDAAADERAVPLLPQAEFSDDEEGDQHASVLQLLGAEEGPTVVDAAGQPSGHDAADDPNFAALLVGTEPPRPPADEGAGEAEGPVVQVGGDGAVPAAEDGAAGVEAEEGGGAVEGDGTP